MWNRIARRMVRSLRGKRSQAALSRRLGYKSNPVREWEAGRRYPAAREVFRLAALVGVDVRAALERFHPACARDLPVDRSPDDVDIANWLTALRGSTPVTEIARRSGRSRFAVSRWLAGDTQPRLPELFELVEAITARCSDLVAELIDIDDVPELRGLHRQRLAARHLAFEEPWTEAIMRVVETRSYQQLPRHRAGWLAEQLDIELETEERCVERLLDAGVVRFHGDKLVPHGSLSIDTGSNPEGVRRIKQHWARVGLERLEAPRGEDLFAYNAISLSRKDLETVRSLLQKTYREIRAIVAATDSEEVSALVQIQLLGWSE